MSVGMHSLPSRTHPWVSMIPECRGMCYSCGVAETFGKARLPEAGVQWGMISPQDIAILLFSWRAERLQLSSALLP